MRHINHFITYQKQDVTVDVLYAPEVGAVIIIEDTNKDSMQVSVYPADLIGDIAKMIEIATDAVGEFPWRGEDHFGHTIVWVQPQTIAHYVMDILENQ